MNQVVRFIKSLRALGANQIWNYAVYTLQLRSDLFRNSISVDEKHSATDTGDFHPLQFADRDTILPFLEADSERIMAEAQRIAGNRFTPFMGNTEALLDFVPLNPTVPWTNIRLSPQCDVKLIWEPARFCWALSLVRARELTKNTDWETCFWNLANTFTQKNPAGFGENWLSAQEAAIRIITLSFCASVFLRDSKSASKYTRSLAQIIRKHAERIPPTLCYARSQNNNHWLSEAAGLMTAACVLPDSKKSAEWFETGWREFQKALNQQILPDGTYIQYSSNYHRMMLQLVLWTDLLLRKKNLEWPSDLRQKIVRSIRWLAGYTDKISGKCCNLGHNDGTYLLPLGGAYSDYRPTLQALSRIFMDKPLYPAGPWDEMGGWFRLESKEQTQIPEKSGQRTYLEDTVFRIGDDQSWALLQACGYKSRPAHDDQLNVHIWHNGKCAALDAGTFRYSSAPPWENGLKSAFVHNSLLIDRTEPMTNAGKFLWLDWDQARILEKSDRIITAEHFAFRKFGLNHCRTLEKAAGWVVTDLVSPVRPSSDSGTHLFRLHWLLADQQFQIEKSDSGWIFTAQDYRIDFSCRTAPLTINIVRAGEQIYSSENYFEQEKIRDISGWISHTYDNREPALSVIITSSTQAPFSIRTRWQFFQ